MGSIAEDGLIYEVACGIAEAGIADNGCLKVQHTSTSSCIAPCFGSIAENIS